MSIVELFVVTALGAAGALPVGIDGKPKGGAVAVDPTPASDVPVQPIPPDESHAGRNVAIAAILGIGASYGVGALRKKLAK